MDIKGITETIDSIPSRSSLHRLFTILNLLCVSILTNYTVDFLIKDDLIPATIDHNFIFDFIVSGKVLIPILTFILVWVITKMISTYLGQKSLNSIMKITSDYYPEIDKLKRMSISDQKKYVENNSMNLIPKIFILFFDGHEIENELKKRHKTNWLAQIQETKYLYIICFDPLIRFISCVILIYFQLEEFSNTLGVIFILSVIFISFYILLTYSMIDILHRYILSYSTEE